MLRGILVGLALLAAGCAGQADTSDTAAATTTSTTIDLIEQQRQEDLRKAREATKARYKDLERCAVLGQKLTNAMGRQAELEVAGRSTTAAKREVDRYLDARAKLHCPNRSESQYEDYPEPTPEDYGFSDPWEGMEPDPPEEPEPDLWP